MKSFKERLCVCATAVGGAVSYVPCRPCPRFLSGALTCYPCQPSSCWRLEATAAPPSRARKGSCLFSTRKRLASAAPHNQPVPPISPPLLPVLLPYPTNLQRLVWIGTAALGGSPVVISPRPSVLGFSGFPSVVDEIATAVTGVGKELRVFFYSKATQKKISPWHDIPLCVLARRRPPSENARLHAHPTQQKKRRWHVRLQAAPFTLAPARKRARRAAPCAHGGLLIFCAQFSNPSYPPPPPHATAYTDSLLQLQHGG